MRFLMIFSFLLGLTLFAPQVTAQSAVPDMAPSTPGLSGLSRGQVIAIGVGAVAGAFILHALIPGDFTFLAGSIGGGLLADYWYNNGGVDTLTEPINNMQSGTAGTRFMEVRLTR